MAAGQAGRERYRPDAVGRQRPLSVTGFTDRAWSRRLRNLPDDGVLNLEQT
jgi:hypothetical protein